MSQLVGVQMASGPHCASLLLQVSTVITVCFFLVEMLSATHSFSALAPYVLAFFSSSSYNVPPVFSTHANSHRTRCNR